jgi:hypothetical protein
VAIQIGNNVMEYGEFGEGAALSNQSPICVKWSHEPIHGRNLETFSHTAKYVPTAKNT